MSETLQWIGIRDERLNVLGLPWHKIKYPYAWRIPGDVQDRIPDRVREQARYSSGGRVLFCCTAKQLHLRVSALAPKRPGSLDVYVNGEYWKSEIIDPNRHSEIAVFDGVGCSKKDVTLYLPCYQEAAVLALGVDAEAVFYACAPFASDLPLVFYGSSVVQGAGAFRPSMTYEAILSRNLNVDFVNFGFGGVGKAEPDVVDLVNQIEASAYILDLGKSYGMQSSEPYAAMLGAIRTQHPATPVFCVTPIYSAKERYDPEYAKLSRHTRQVVERSVNSQGFVADAHLHLVDGLCLLGPKDAGGFVRGRRASQRIGLPHHRDAP